jgi:hypothetical protein
MPYNVSSVAKGITNAIMVSKATVVSKVILVTL